MSDLVAPLGFAIIGALGLIVWNWWWFIGVTREDRAKIEAHYSRREERVTGLRRAGFEYRISGGVRIFEVELADREGRLTIRKIGVDFPGYSGQKLWRYDAEGRRHPIF